MSQEIIKRRNLEYLFNSMLGSSDVDFALMIGLLREFVESVSDHDLSSDFRIILSLRHLLFILEDGFTVYAGCRWQATEDFKDVLVIERIRESEAGPQKILAKLSSGNLSRDPSAFHSYLNGPSIIVYISPIEIQIEDAQIALKNPVNHLSTDAFTEIFRNKQMVTDQRHCNLINQTNSARQAFERILKLDRRVNQLIASKSSDEALIAPRRYERSRHPYLGPLLHILPRLLRPSFDQSVLQMIQSQLSDISSFGFSGVILAPVDKQTVHTYFDEGALGQLTAHFNNHGYWCSGEPGIDPALGTAEDYAALLHASAAAGICFMQDCTFATLGYPAQRACYAASSLSSPITELMVGESAVNVWDTSVFLPISTRPALDAVERRSSLEIYAAELTQAHVGDVFALPRPNLYRRKVLRSIMARSLELIELFGVYAFRIDMSKHIGILPLRRVIKELRVAVQGNLKSSNSQLQFAAILEHRTDTYRDIRFAMDGVGDEDSGIYFYDFPLAAVLQKIFIDGCSMIQEISGLLSGRSAWSINPYQLIPTFIDHDERFRPIYNGGQETSDIVVVGYALAMMLSTNGPAVYVGFEDARLGPPEFGDYYKFTEQHSRKMKDELFKAGDTFTPASSVGMLLKLFMQLGDFAHRGDDCVSCRGAFDWIEISRSICNEEKKSSRHLQALFCRGEIPSEMSSTDGEVLFQYEGIYSITISLAIKINQ